MKTIPQFMIFFLISTTISIFCDFSNRNWISFLEFQDNRVLAQSLNNNLTTKQNQADNQMLKTLAEKNKIFAALEFSERICTRGRRVLKTDI
ncbi:hypothetical protein I8748_27885 [Nostoc sp. CENA67]|uniref:Uncharacterized protein n=1 Tax=Amazonocrinis nigriterrae CENA67 TaxID=2794033 RepID=A0A8J7LAW9_9NOST|nr:hypothetical protein [Amazonocrinis nigriterrae]MBH8565943.1 hypothetical protein [Amazonocrinis nigriterrae CENA67]